MNISIKNTINKAKQKISDSKDKIILETKTKFEKNKEKIEKTQSYKYTCGKIKKIINLIPKTKKSRALRMAALTMLGVKKQGYFIPYRYAHSASKAEDKICYSAIGKILNKNIPNYKKNITKAAKHITQLEKYNTKKKSTNILSQIPKFNQDWLPRLDAIMAYHMVTECKPKKIIEIGCGHSTRFMQAAIKDKKIKTSYAAIDPLLRIDRPAQQNIHYHDDYVQNIPEYLFQALQANDILFIDSSHILMPGSDVDFLLNGILPNLKKGVVVHIHDIFLPDGYPENWEWRGYNEQLAVATMLIGQEWEILMANAYALKACSDELKQSKLLDITMPEGAYESSLWIKKL